MAETISWGILFHGISNMSCHSISCGGALLAPFGSGCGDVLEHEEELVIEDEVHENERMRSLDEYKQVNLMNHLE